MEAVSNKSIWTLICSGGVQTEPGILETEFLAQESLLALGLSTYAKNTKESLDRFKSDKSVGDTWKDFVLKLSNVFGVDETICWELLCNYLATEFRGTSESLADLLKNESQVKPLIVDIWHFYRAERLYLLQVLKEVITHHNDQDHDHREVFEKVFEKIDADGKLKHELVEQYKDVIKEKSPNTDIIGSQLGGNVRKSWLLFNLREQSELLQLIMLYFHQTGEYLAGDWISMFQIFSGHHFGVKQLQQLRSGDESDTCQQLGLNVTYLQSAVLLQLLDLPGVAADPDNHHIFSSDKTQEIGGHVSGLGDLRPHGPIMLAWMLGQFMARGQAGLQTYQRLGEVAMGNNVLQVLQDTLQGDFTAHSLVSDILHSLVYGVMSALIQAFDPSSMGLGLDTHKIVVKLLSHHLIAGHFWKNPLGLSVYFDELKSQYPLEQSSFMEVCVSLASASPSSCSRLISTLSSLSSLTDKLDNVPQSSLRPVSGASYQLSRQHFPYPGTQTVCVPSGTMGELLSSGMAVRFAGNYNGWQIMLAEIGHLASQLESGAGYVSPDCLKKVTSIGKLVASVTRSDPSLWPQLGQILASLMGVADRYCHTPSPPLHLLASVLDTLANVASVAPTEAVSRLERTSLLPRLASDGVLYPGVVGQLLAGQETVAGDFPSLLAFLRLVTLIANQDSCTGCISFILSEVLPHYNQWRYEVAADRDTIARLSLEAVILHSSSDRGLRMMAGDRGLARALLVISSTGDRTIQTLLEQQTSWEVGRGTQLVQVVQLALQLLHQLVTDPGSGPAVMSGPVGQAIRSPPAGVRSHYLLTLSHYTYFHHSPQLATAAIKLLAAIAGASDQLSVLACLGPAAPAVKDQLLSRLESNTEDIRLKLAIIQLLVSCVQSQPGLLQLLMDLNGPPSSSDGCLAPVLRLLSHCNKETGDTWRDLHLVIVQLVDSLWSRSTILATSHLKKQPNFWSELAQPLTNTTGEDEANVKMMKIKSFILRVISHEIYTWTGNMSSDLQTVVASICDEKSPALANWCNVDSHSLEATTTGDLNDDEEDDKNVPLFLLSSWRSFLLVLSKDSPSSLSPSTCRTIFSSTTSKLSSILLETSPPARLTVLLAETCLMMSRRWQTKVTCDMTSWVTSMATMLARLTSSWSTTHPRARLAILATALTTLKMSDFKLDIAQDGGVLGDWLDPVLEMMRIIFAELESVFASSDQKEGEFLRCPELILSLVSGLVSRLPDKIWLSGLHHHCSLQLLLSAAEACIKYIAAPGFVSGILSLLIEICSCTAGCAAVLLHDLARHVWLPVSDLATCQEMTSSSWARVRHVTLQLAGTLVRVGRRQGVGPAVTAVALLQDKIVADLLSARQGLDQLESATSATRLVWSLAEYVTAWQTDHCTSLQMVYRGCCRLLHTTTALVMRPSLLASLVSGPGQDTTQTRDRRLSSSCSEADLDTVLSPEAISVQSQLLEISSGCLALLVSLSPPLQSLLAGDALLDPDRWQPLLSPSFSPPSLDQDLDTPSYGLLLSLANICVRSGVSRDTARSPSPSRSAPGPLNDKMTLVLELTLTVLVSQSVLTLATPHHNQRDKQLLRRELGAELGSIIDTWRRHATRGGRSPAPTRAAKSPGPLTSTPAPHKAPPRSPAPPPSSPQSRCSNRDSSDNYIKFVSAIVANVFK